MIQIASPAYYTSVQRARFKASTALAYSAVAMLLAAKAGLYNPPLAESPSQPWPTLGQAKQMRQNHATSFLQTKADF